jgi:hypothetical protein
MWRALAVSTLLLMLPVVTTQAWLDADSADRWQLSLVVGPRTMLLWLDHDPAASKSHPHSALQQRALSAVIHLMDRWLMAWVLVREQSAQQLNSHRDQIQARACSVCLL